MGIQRSLLLLGVMALCWSSSTASNVLYTGETLANNESIGLPGVGSFVMQEDCDLVLYDNNGTVLFSTNTTGPSRQNCTLSLTNYGRLEVRTPDSELLWNSSNTNSPNGSYAAVFRPDGDVAIYGPLHWSGFARGHNMKTEKEQELLGNIPTVNNMLFSGQVLYGNDELTNGLTSLKVRDCELEQTWLFFSWPLVSVQGEDCFVRLNFRGQLTIIDDTGKNSSALPTAANPTKGEYVLILEGLLAQIYGPSAWSTNVRGVQPIVHLMLPSDAQE